MVDASSCESGTYMYMPLGSLRSNVSTWAPSFFFGFFFSGLERRWASPSHQHPHKQKRKEETKRTVTLSGIQTITTLPSLFSNLQCSSRILSPLNRIDAGTSLSNRPTYRPPTSHLSTRHGEEVGLVWGGGEEKGNVRWYSRV